MRKIGQLPSGDQAERFVDYLLTRQISAVAEPESEPAGEHAIWIRDEDQLPAALEELDQFRAQPDAPQYGKAAAKAERLRREQRREAARRKKLQRRMPRSSGAFSGGQRSTPVTIVIGITAILVALLTDLGRPAAGSAGQQIVQQLRFADIGELERQASPDPLTSIRQGQLWRLISPIFLHFGMIHLLFNMLMFFTIGSALERLFGSARLLMLVFVTALISNYAQATFPEWLGGNPNFGGMSGVVYGLFGYLWILPLARPNVPIRIPDATVLLLLGWLLLGMLPMFPLNIANVAHVAGLLSGIALVAPTAMFTR